MRTNTAATVLGDAELIELLAYNPELLALSDAYAATQRRYWRQTQTRRRVIRTSLIAAILATIAVPAAAFADQIGSFLGIYDGGTPVPTTALPRWQAPALAQLPELNGSNLRQIGQRDGVSFYAAKSNSGGYCFAVGLAATPTIDALKCGADTDGFPAATPVSDFSFLNYSGNTVTITRLAGFATAPVVRVGVVGSDGTAIFSTPVTAGVYADAGVPQMPAAAIVGYDASNAVVYRRPLSAPPIPQPQVP